jgi:hypothetical protein
MRRTAIGGGAIPIRFDDNVAASFGTGSDCSLVFDGTDFRQTCVSTSGLMICMDGATCHDPQGVGVEVTSGTSFGDGNYAVNANAVLVVQRSPRAYFQLTSAANDKSCLLFGEPLDADENTICGLGSGDTPASALAFGTATVDRMILDADSLDFQQATTITCVGDCTIDATGNTVLANLVQFGDHIEWETLAGITASTTQSQGQQPLVDTISEVSTVANDADVVTLPAAAEGRVVVVKNNGANDLQVFPASGDNLGGGTNVSIELHPNCALFAVASGADDWEVVTNGHSHSEMFDAQNTDAFVVSDAGGDADAITCYHTNGLATDGASLGGGWSFDAGGAGTSFPIASIADSAGSPGSQILVTTTGSHTLAVGAIVSLTNLSAGTAGGIYEVVATASATTFEVAETDSTNATGTMDECATMTAPTGGAGKYDLKWNHSASSSAATQVFDFWAYIGATQQAKTEGRNEYALTSFSSTSGGGNVAIADGDKVAFALVNTSGANNITLRTLNVRLDRF